MPKWNWYDSKYWAKLSNLPIENLSNMPKTFKKKVVNFYEYENVNEAKDKIKNFMNLIKQEH